MKDIDEKTFKKMHLYFGNNNEVAKALGVTKGAFIKWKFAKKIPINKINWVLKKLNQKSNNKFTLEELAPGFDSE